MVDVVKCYESYFSDPSAYTFPKRVIAELTSHCNISCAMCPRRYGMNKQGYLDLGLFKKIVDEVSCYPGTGLTPFFRGEPLLHPEFLRMIQYLKSKSIKPVLLATNATLLSKEISDGILDAGIDFVSFSLDGIDEESYGRVRAGADYAKVMENIGYFLKAKKSGKLALPEVQVSLVETGQTSCIVDEFIAKWIDKVDRVRIYPGHSSEAQYGRLSPGMLKNITPRKPCLKPLIEIAVYADGEVALCNHDWQRKNGLGNVKDYSIKEIWGSEAYNKIRQAHYSGKIHGSQPCGGCDHWMAYYLESGIIGKLYTNKKGISSASEADV
jgi:radical SAM protein with 4Fe4S-binding SPASM domain